MAQNIRDIMTPDPIAIPATAVLTDVSRVMRDANIGAVVVMDMDKICGIVTDRDIVVRAIATKRDPSRAALGDICTREVATLSPSDTIESAAQIMREKAVRRLPVVEDNRLVGIVSLGDVAIEQDRGSTLANVSAAPANQ